MKILFVSHYAGSYGANRSLVDLAAELKSRGNDVLVVLPGRGQVESRLEAADVPYRIFYHRQWVVDRNTRFLFLRGLASRLANLVADLRLFFLAKSWGADLIHINSSCTPVGFHPSRWLRIPLVWHIREYLEEDYDLRFLDSRKATREFRQADRVIAVSRDVARKYQKMIGDKLGVIYNGVDVRSCPSRPILGGKRIDLLLVGALLPGKGHVDAIRAVHLASSRLGIDLHLRIVGQGSQGYEDRLRKLVIQLDLQDRVEFLGYVEDASSLRREADIGLVCSAREAFGRVTVEAMGSGLLVVASRSGGTCEIVRDQSTGLLYQAGDPWDLAQILAWISRNRTTAQAIADRGRRQCVKAFNLERVADEVLGVYSECLGSHEAPRFRGLVPDGYRQVA